jgi:hypothetical protein
MHDNSLTYESRLIYKPEIKFANITIQRQMDLGLDDGSLYYRIMVDSHVPG